jgi:hypothetical protein
VDEGGGGVDEGGEEELGIGIEEDEIGGALPHVPKAGLHPVPQYAEPLPQK